MSDPLPSCGTAVLSDPWTLVCPQCRGIDLLALARVFANSARVHALYRCRRCLTELRNMHRHHLGPLESVVLKVLAQTESPSAQAEHRGQET
jgi:hypothetical protein